MNNLTSDQIKEKLRILVHDYRTYPDEITAEVDAKFKEEAMPYINELNGRLLKTWMDAGGIVVGGRPFTVDFRSLIKNGI